MPGIKNKSNQPLQPPANCITCDYNLAYLTTTSCPECGRPFDPSDPQTYINPKQVKIQPPPFTPYFLSIILITTFLTLIPYVQLLNFFILIPTLFISIVALTDQDYQRKPLALFTCLYIITMFFFSILLLNFYLTLPL
ncbi:hypothetical protein KS4_00330 [Poriferisphaera corsica]|uniref:Uncharacterized protein n=1 Tax=Poriferisphaera corsica TaxID=2528020 RepID=A0A517YP54_9BACT|nr:hypothetical protein [Poriferisphaera corsica]QDU32005.1 hypothetical protein KS4_00330 [Poriferisphaera corsica]